MDVGGHLAYIKNDNNGFQNIGLLFNTSAVVFQI